MCIKWGCEDEGSRNTVWKTRSVNWEVNQRFKVKCQGCYSRLMFLKNTVSPPRSFPNTSFIFFIFLFFVAKLQIAFRTLGILIIFLLNTYYRNKNNNSFHKERWILYMWYVLFLFLFLFFFFFFFFFFFLFPAKTNSNKKKAENHSHKSHGIIDIYIYIYIYFNLRVM